MKDQMGNDVNEGDVVHAKCGNEWFIGVVQKVQNGGISVTGVHPQKGMPVNATPVTPDTLVLQVTIAFQGQPGVPQPGLLRCVAPKQGPTLVQ